MPSNITVKVQADVLPLQAQMAIAKAEAAGFTKELNAMARQAVATGGDLDNAIKAKMASAGQEVALAKTRINELAAQMHPASESIRGFGGAITQAEELLAGFGVVAGLHMLKHTFEEIVEKAEAFGIQNAQLAATLGIDQQEAAGLSGALQAVGSSTDSYVGMVMKLERQLKTNEAALNSYGMTTRDVNGHLLTGQELMDSAIATMQQYKAGTDQNEFALEAFGRGAAEVYTIMRANKELQDAYSDTLNEFGVNVGPRATAEALNMEHAHAKLKAQTEALQLVIGQALLPVVTQMLTDFGNTGVIEGFANSFKFMGKTVDTVAAIMAGTAVTIETVVNEAIHGTEALGDVATLNFDAAKARWNDMKNDFSSGASQITNIFRRLEADLQRLDLGGAVFGGGSGGEASPFKSGNRIFEPFKKGAHDAAKSAEQDFASMLDEVVWASMEQSREIIQNWNAMNEAVAKGADVSAGEQLKSLQLLAQYHAIFGNEEIAKEREIEQRRYQAVQDAINREIISDKERITRLEANERQHQQRLSEIDRQALSQRLAMFHQGWGIMSSGFNSALSNMAFHGETFEQGMGEMALSVGEGFLNMALTAAENWGESLVQSLLFEKPADLAKITDASAVAGANAYAAYAEFPPLAAAMAAEAVASTMSFAGLLSAEGGLERVEYDGQMIRAHAGEAVLPRRIAEPLMSVVQHLHTGGGGPSLGHSQVNVTYNVRAFDSHDVSAFLRRNHVKNAHTKMFKDAVRGGKLSSLAG